MDIPEEKKNIFKFDKKHDICTYESRCKPQDSLSE